MKWLLDEYKTTEAISVTHDFNTLISGKKILTGPEGFGKSTDVLFACADIYMGNPVIYSTHTIENAKEKYKWMTTNYPLIAHRFKLVLSDSELFRMMIAAQDVELSDIFRKNLGMTKTKFINFDMYSCDKGILNSLGVGKTNYKKFRYTQDNATEYNSIVMSEIYNSLNSVHGTLDYYITYALVDEQLDTQAPTIGENLQDILKRYNYDVKSVNFYLEKEYSARLVCVTGQAIRNWRGIRKQRDADMKASLEDDSTIIITQNKVTERLILPMVEKQNLDVNLILDEFTPDCFKHITNSDINKLGRIVNKIVNSGMDALTKTEEFLLSDHHLLSKFKTLETNDGSYVELDNLNVQITPEGMSEYSMGKVNVAQRLLTRHSTLVLTTELLPSIIMCRYYGYEAYELKKGFKYCDSAVTFYPTNNKTDLCVTKGNATDIASYLDMVKHTEPLKDDTVSIGTSYFDTDYTLESCKGRNITPKKHVTIVKNPESATRSVLFANLVQQNETIHDIDRNELHETIRVCISVDLLNQALGRFSGYRKVQHPDAKIDVLYYEHDYVFRKAIENIRYTGVFGNIKELYNLIKHKFNYITLKYNYFSNLLDVFEDRVEMGLELSKPNVQFSLDEVLRSNKYTKMGMISDMIPRMLQIHSPIYINYSNYILTNYNDKTRGVSKWFRQLIGYEKIDSDFNQSELFVIKLLAKSYFWTVYYKGNNQALMQMLANSNHLLTSLLSPFKLKETGRMLSNNKVRLNHLNNTNKDTINGFDFLKLLVSGEIKCVNPNMYDSDMVFFQTKLKNGRDFLFKPQKRKILNKLDLLNMGRSISYVKELLSGKLAFDKQLFVNSFTNEPLLCGTVQALTEIGPHEP